LLLETCLTVQDNSKALLDYFQIKYRQKVIPLHTRSQCDCQQILSSDIVAKFNQNP